MQTLSLMTTWNSSSPHVPHSWHLCFWHPSGRTVAVAFDQGAVSGSTRPAEADHSPVSGQRDDYGSANAHEMFKTIILNHASRVTAILVHPRIDTCMS